VLSEHRRDHGSLDAVSLLRLASGNERRTSTTTASGTARSIDDRVDGYVDELLDGTDGWVDDLLAG